MKQLTNNIVPICFIALAAYFVYLGIEGWGWCIFGGIMTCTVEK